MARFYDVSSGQVRIDGVDVRQLADVQLRREVLMLTQEVFLFSASILENIRMENHQASDEQVKAAAKQRWVLMRSLSVCVTAESQLGRGGITCLRVSVSWCPCSRVLGESAGALDEATASLDIPSERAVQAARGPCWRAYGAGDCASPRRFWALMGAGDQNMTMRAPWWRMAPPQQLIASGVVVLRRCAPPGMS